MLGAQPDEGAVRAAHVGEIHVAVVLARDATMEPGDVAVFGEEDVAALAPEVDAGLRYRERVAGRVAPDDQRDAPDVAAGGAAQPFDAVGARALTDERLEADDFLSDAEDVLVL